MMTLKGDIFSCLVLSCLFLLLKYHQDTEHMCMLLILNICQQKEK